MKVTWSPPAIQDRLSIWFWISSENHAAAIHMESLFDAAADRLANHPELGKPGEIPGSRELVVHESYRLVYEFDPQREEVEILTLSHTHRQWPPLKR